MSDLTFEQIEKLINATGGIRKAINDLKNCHRQNDTSEGSFFQYHLLNLLIKMPNLTQKELASFLHITPATLSVRIQRLEKLELVVRKCDKDDKRIQHLEVTKKGQEMANMAQKHFQTMVLKMFNGFSVEEVQAMICFMQRIEDNINSTKGEISCSN